MNNYKNTLDVTSSPSMEELAAHNGFCPIIGKYLLDTRFFTARFALSS